MDLIQCTIHLLRYRNIIRFDKRISHYLHIQLEYVLILNTHSYFLHMKFRIQEKKCSDSIAFALCIILEQLRTNNSFLNVYRAKILYIHRKTLQIQPQQILIKYVIWKKIFGTEWRTCTINERINVKETCE